MLARWYAGWRKKSSDEKQAIQDQVAKIMEQERDKPAEINVYDDFVKDNAIFKEKGIAWQPLP